MLHRFAALLLLIALSPFAAAAQLLPRTDEGMTTEEGARVFQETFSAIRSYSLLSPGDSAMWEMALQGLIEKIDDPYATVFTREEVEAFEEETTGNYAGIGVQITDLNNEVTITAVFRDTPAERAGLQVGDVIVTVDGERSASWNRNDVSERIRGRPGTEVRVGIRRSGLRGDLEQSLVRDQVHVSSVVADTIFDDIGYISLDRVAHGSAMEVDSALALFADSRGMILDLRQNPGGVLTESLHIADLFLPVGRRLASVRGRNGGDGRPIEETWEGRLPPRMPELPIVILVDRFTASAAEIVAGALQDHDRALVLGERTFGKGVVQTILPLHGGRQLRLTTGEWFTPLGRSLNRPRNRDGIPIPNSADTGTVRTPGGREIPGGGGVFPDLQITNDTFRVSERAFLDDAVKAEYPLAQRIQEVAFELSREVRAGTIEPELSGATPGVERFLSGMEEAGIARELVRDAEVVDYLLWRLEVTLHQRLADEGRAIEVRARRDPVLSEAIRLLSRSGSQRALFDEAEEVRTSPHRTARSSVGG